MIDSFGREISYLRISVTDRCNLRCTYCMPEEGVLASSHNEILRFEEIEQITRVMASLGVKRVRITGGEPLVRKNLSELIKNINNISGIEYIGLTTNGLLLEKNGDELFSSGLDGVNISLDSLNPERYAKFTRRSTFKEALKGIEKALSLGFKSVKLNCVLSAESIEEDWLGVISLAKDLPISVRLIEFMPLSSEEKNLVSADEAKSIIESIYGNMLPLEKQEGGPAKVYKLNNFVGTVGIIGAMSNCFCESCNRVRLTADGDLKLCLFYDQGISLKPLLREGIDDESLKEIIKKTIVEKPQKHMGKKKVFENKNSKILKKKRTMSKIGG